MSTKPVALFQIDSITTLKPETDTSLLLMNKLLCEGYKVFFYYVEDLIYLDGRIFALCTNFSGEQNEGKKVKIDIDAEAQFLFIRQDPPFDMKYLTPLYLLSRLKKCKVLNNPNSILMCPEKLFVLNFSDLMPKTMITSNIDEITQFWHANGDIIIKPLYSHAGMGVFLIKKDDKNLFNTVRILLANYNGVPVIAQKYIEGVKKGDKRILFAGGEVVGVINRIQAEDYAISNTAVGGVAKLCEVKQYEQKIIDAISPFLKELDLFLVGIDVIDGLITEINVTSPTGFVLYSKLSGIKIEDIIFQKLCQNYL